MFMKVSALGCAVAVSASSAVAQLDVDVVNAFPNLTFTQAVDLKAAHDGTDRLFVVERSGIIWVFPNDPGVTSAEREVFLDLSARFTPDGDEVGVLGIVFHPEYETNGEFFVTYTRPNPGRRSFLTRWSVDPTDPDRADVSSEEILLEQAQPRRDHNIHRMDFGPDGMLYVSVGDGGCCDDPFMTAQDRTDIRGSILRLDVDSPPDAGLPYTIPPDNPFVGNANGWREEIFCFGLRNPWRFSFDADGRLWVGDVGQDDWEEISWATSGANMGWPLLEGSSCFELPPGCDTSGLVLPIVEYPHGFNPGSGLAVTGGHVYGGTSCGMLRGKYVYADFASGNIWALTFDDEGFVNTENFAPLTGRLISGFGEDEGGELYATDFRISGGGVILKFECESAVCAGDCDGSGAVDFNDLVSMLFEFGAPEPTAGCDADGSGVVDFNDLVSALFVFGDCG